MYSLSQLRRRVDALRRKCAKELAVVQLRPLAEDFSQQWAVALSNRSPLSGASPNTASASTPLWPSTTTWSAAAARIPSPTVMASLLPCSPSSL